MLDKETHFDLSDADKVKENLEKLSCSSLPFKEHTEMLPLVGDIKSMFDIINPPMVREAINWLLEETRKLKRTDRIAINFRERKARYGRSYGDQFN